MVESPLSVAVMGVDPGVRGGISVLAADGRILGVYALNPAMTRKEFLRVVYTAATQLNIAGSSHCFMEKVGHIRGDGAQGSFTFGRVVGLLEGSLSAYGVEIHEVTPVVWQSRMECLTGGNKNVSKSRAKTLFPYAHKDITHSTADALLIAEFGRRRLAL